MRLARGGSLIHPCLLLCSRASALAMSSNARHAPNQLDFALIDGRSVSFRTGEQSDMSEVFTRMLSELMNPLSLRADRFIVADSVRSAGQPYERAPVAFGQIRELGNTDQWELASVWVKADWRGSGLGTELVRRLRSMHRSAGRQEKDLFLLTLRKTTAWYEALGFEVLELEGPSVPEPMRFEIKAGKAVTGLIGEELACMRGVPE
jgi:N-acetylglutamate synthase-like GNAT family acetyltransferase